MRTKPSPRRSIVLIGALTLAASLIVSTTQAAPGDDDQPQPESVSSKSDQDTVKLDEKLQDKVESGSTETVYVFVTVTGNTAQVKKLLDDAASAEANGDAIVVGSATVQQLPKIASLKSVVSIGLVELKKSGRPLGVPDPDLNHRPTKEELNAALKGLYKREVPYSKAPKLKRSHFDRLKKLGVLDAKTHNFAGAWKDGYTGEGVTVGVVDGGTDWGIQISSVPGRRGRAR